MTRSSLFLSFPFAAIAARASVGSVEVPPNHSPLFCPFQHSKPSFVSSRAESSPSFLLGYNDRYVSSLISLFGLDKGSLLPISISQTTEELHKHTEEILIKFGLVKSIPDNPHNTKTNSILLVVIQNKGHSHLSFVY